jgi:exodeoxyribonuclease VII large subunit
MNNNALTISEINKIIKNIIDNDEFLRDVSLVGEISNLKFHTRGHLYFSLKDDSSKINAVMFNYASQKLNFVPKDGDSVIVKGKITVYEASGSYQILVSEMIEDGVGDLYVIFEKLKQRLNEEGLFDKSHKRKIMKIPSTIGVITAPTGAAIKDIISTINRRFPLVTIILFPSLVQGEGAKENIVKMINIANTYNIDTLIVGRGGGSIEDLWAFNEEVVARSIYNSKIPVVSAVGHEIDFTISDFVADLRAPTPTAAAELVVPDKNEIIRYLNDVKTRLNTQINKILINFREKIKKYETNFILNNPNNLYTPQEQKLDHIIEILNSNMSKNLNNKNNLFINIKLKFNMIDILYKKDKIYNEYKTKLELLNPKYILNKGYSITYIDGKIVKSVKDIKKGNNIKSIFTDGEVISEVKEVK